MDALHNLKVFYKSERVRDPWAMARAIVDGTAGSASDMYQKKYPWIGTNTKDGADPATEKKKRKLMAAIVRGVGQNPFSGTKSMDDPNDFIGLLLKGSVNGKKFSYDEKGHKDAVAYATQLMEDKKPVDFKWYAGKPIEKIHPAAAALAGWWLGGNIRDDYQRISALTPAQQREFERQVQQSMRNKGRRMKKESAVEKMQTFFQKDSTDTYVRKTPVKNAVQADDLELQKIMSLPPFAGARFDPAAHRWVKPENIGQTYEARGGKKRFRGSGTGAHERSVSGHGKGRIRAEGAGAKHKGETHLAATRRKEGFTHAKQTGRKKG